MRHLIFILSVVLIYSCQDKSKILTENGVIIDSIYYCDKFDWKIVIPDGYALTNIAQREDLENTGFSIVKEVVPEGYEIRKNRPHLIGFQLDEFNCFSSSFESFEETNMTMDEHQIFVSKIQKDSFDKIEGIDYEQHLSTETIGNYQFFIITSKIYKEGSRDLLLTQQIFNTKIDGHLFSSLITYKNKEVFEVLNQTFRNSLKE